MGIDRFVREIIIKKPDVLGISVTSRMFLVTMASLAKIHEALPETRIVLGGIHPTFMARNIVKTFPFVDCVLKGEAERSFSELLVSYADNSSDNRQLRIRSVGNVISELELLKAQGYKSCVILDDLFVASCHGAWKTKAQDRGDLNVRNRCKKEWAY